MVNIKILKKGKHHVKPGHDMALHGERVIVWKRWE